MEGAPPADITGKAIFSHIFKSLKENQKVAGKVEGPYKSQRDLHVAYKLALAQGPGKEQEFYAELESGYPTYMAMLRPAAPAPEESTENAAVEAAPEAPTCEQLFDPCTKEAITPNTLEELESRVKKLKQALTAPEASSQLFPLAKASRLDLLLWLLNRPTPPGEDLFQYTINGQLYEAYWDIVFALNLLESYPPQNCLYVNKKAEELTSLEDVGILTNPVEYLAARGVNMGASGASDITFCYTTVKKEIIEDPCSSELVSAASVEVAEGGAAAKPPTKPKFYFCSSKYYKQDSQKSVEKFDIQKIYTAAKNLHIEYDISIILLVKDRVAVEQKLRKAISKYISEEASAVYGQQDLFAALTKLYDMVRSRVVGPITSENLIATLGLGAAMPRRPWLTPRLHQHMAILKISAAVQEFARSPGGSNKFLVGIVPRGGKTYIAGGLVSTLQPKRVVVLLGAKSETLGQFKRDLFEGFQDFASYTVVDVLEDDIAIDPAKKYIFIMSVELYKTKVTTRRLLQELKGGPNRADLFICDEAHLKQTTKKAVDELEAGTAAIATDEEESDELARLDEAIGTAVPVVYMTGTYIKPLSVFKIPPEHTILWEYQDIQAGKTLSTNETYFTEAFGYVYQEALQKCFAYGDTYESIEVMYKRFPELYLLSTQFTEDAREAFHEQSSGGFPSLTQLFQVKKEFSPKTVAPSLWHTGFTNPKGMGRLINYLSPRSEVPDADPIGSVMKRIDKIAQRIGDRLAFFTTDFIVHSQLWFLPTMQGHPLEKRLCALAGIIFQSPWYRANFDILAISSSVDWSKIPGAKSSSIDINGGTFSWACPRGGIGLKECIVAEELKARKKGKGLVILAQNMLHLGISLACVDIVVLLDIGEKVDERIQKMYRALTESPNKKGGYIVDMNYFRTVVAIMNYQIKALESRKRRPAVLEDIADTFNTVLETYSIDDDLAVYKETVASTTIPELERLISHGSGKSNSIVLSAAGAAMDQNIENAIGKDYAKSLDEWLGEMKEAEEGDRLLRAEGEGVEVAEEENTNNEGEPAPKAPRLFSEEVESNPLAKKQAFLEIFRTTLKLGVFGTNLKTIAEVKEALAESEDLRSLVFDTLVTRGAIVEDIRDPEGQKEFLFTRLILPELDAIIASEKNGSYQRMKESFNSRTEKFDDVLKYILAHLTPKEAERKKFGEIFTPLELVDEMLATLPADVWENKDLKWLDPANGMGNFPIKAFIGQTEGKYTYPGLFEGLKSKIPDEKARCKWIIENMLYMIDINGKNNMVARRLFEKLCEGATPNIEQINKKEGFLVKGPLKFGGNTVDSFDIIFGNPPYNPPKTETGSSGNSIWQDFVLKSFTILKDNGFLLFVHPPGWKKPTDDSFNPAKKARQGHVWPVLKNAGAFHYIYTNDQRSKAVGSDYLNHFPAVDFYLYQKGGAKEPCDTKNIFLGKVFESKGVRLNYTLPYLPNLVTKETQIILHKITSKEGEKPNFKRGLDERTIVRWEGKEIDWFYDANKAGFKYKKHGMNPVTKSGAALDTVSIDKVVLNFGGGIDGYSVEYVSKEDEKGILDKTLYTPVGSAADGRSLQAFFKSDLVKFIFLITQYASGAITQNEPLVANSIPLPPTGTEDFYAYFGLEAQKEYIEEMLAQYTAFRAPKRVAKTIKARKQEGGAKRFRFTRKHK